MLKIITIIGARPQIIKAAAISRAIKNHFSNKITELLVHTGQHYDENMSAIFFNELNIPREHYNLQCGSGSHAEQTSEIIRKLEPILQNEKPHGMIVYGDTNSTLAGSLTAAKMHIPVVHIEAGMRSFNKTMPEEINRICCDHVSTLLFSPTLSGMQNLIREGFNADAKAPFTINNPAIFHCGDVMFDNSIYFSEKAKRHSNILQKMDLKEGEFMLCTIHRDSNTDNADHLNAIFNALLQLTNIDSSKIIIPLHPRTSKALPKQLNPALLTEISNSQNLIITEPVSFLDMIRLESACKMIITDSGGVQKESYFFEKPCIILRNETEWTELVEQGTAIITGPNEERIIKAYQQLISSPLTFPPIFGNGKASEFICNEILKALN